MDFTLNTLKYFFTVIYNLSPVLLFVLLILFFLSCMVKRKEQWSWIDTLYYTIITAATVGYGDFTPKKNFSKICSILISLLGLIFTGILVAVAINSVRIAFQKTYSNEIKEYKKTHSKEIRELKETNLN